MKHLTYTYDANGNLKSDAAKGITNIIYNYLNLPQVITFTNGRSIEFVYDALGAKLRKTVIAPNVAPIVTDYMNGFEYKDGLLEKIHHTEGYVERKADGSFQYNYTLKDHLGNTRVTFADKDNNGTIDPNTEINQINHYAPFGLNLEGNWNGASPDAKNKYGYNQKELQTDFDLNWNDYGARNYDPAIGRFTTADPMADFRNWVSPYQYVQNNPINRIDPTGMIDQAKEEKAQQMAQTTKDNEAWMNQTRPDGGAWARAKESTTINMSQDGTQQVNDLEGNKHTITANDINKSAKLSPYGMRGYNHYTGALEWETVEGYDIVGCGCCEGFFNNIRNKTYSISVEGAFGGGWGLELGFVLDHNWSFAFYSRLSAAAGMGAFIGAGATIIYPRKGIFTYDQLRGSDINNRFGLGYFTTSFGGNTDKMGLNVDYDPNGYTTSSGMLFNINGKSMLKGLLSLSDAPTNIPLSINLGALRSTGYTWVWKPF